MASKQLNFFITPEEHSRINEMFMQKGVNILHNQGILDHSKVSISKKIPKIEENIFQIYLCRSEFMDKIVINSTEGGTKYFDIDESYLLEFNIGGFYSDDGSLLKRARFYYVKSFYNENDELEKKSNSFCEWSDSVIKDFKKEFLQRYSNDKDFLYSKSAIEWIEENKAEEMVGGLGWKKKV